MKELNNIIRLNKSSDVEACVVHFALDASEITRPFAAFMWFVIETHNELIEELNA